MDHKSFNLQASSQSVKVA